jgi:hypothetical protein
VGGACGCSVAGVLMSVVSAGARGWLTVVGTWSWGRRRRGGLQARLKTHRHAAPKIAVQQAPSASPAPGATIRHIAYQAAVCPPGSGAAQAGHGRGPRPDARGCRRRTAGTLAHTGAVMAHYRTGVIGPGRTSWCPGCALPTPPGVGKLRSRMAHTACSCPPAGAGPWASRCLSRRDGSQGQCGGGRRDNLPALESRGISDHPPMSATSGLPRWQGVGARSGRHRVSTEYPK